MNLVSMAARLQMAGAGTVGLGLLKVARDDGKLSGGQVNTPGDVRAELVAGD